MAVVACLGVVVEIWYTVYGPWQCSFISRIPRVLQIIAMVSPPYFIFLAFSVFAASLATNYPASVGAGNGIYCSIMVDNIGRFVTPAFCGAIMLITFGFEVAILLRCYRGWRRIHNLFPLGETKRPSLSPWLRTVVFLLYSWTTFGACITFLANVVNPFPYMSQAALPLVALLVFGSQKDVIFAWCSWIHKDKPRRDSASPLTEPATKDERVAHSSAASPTLSTDGTSPTSFSSDITDAELHIASMA